MPGRAKRCSNPGCGQQPTGSHSRCDRCLGKQRRRSDIKRGSSTDRGYTSKAHLEFRRAVLERDPWCILCRDAQSIVADHYPISRKDLIAQGIDPDDPSYGRGLCVQCDRLQTAQRENEQGYRYK